MSLLTDLSGLFGDAFASIGLDRAFGEVSFSQRPDLGQFQCNGALPAAKPAGRNPREIAQEVLEVVSGDERIAELSLAGPGFINITLTDEFLATELDELAHDPRLGVAKVTESLSVIVDYGGPNVAKEMHVGHLRPAIIGESIKRILRFEGHQVTGDVHLGDWGTPMGQLIVELSERMPELPYFDPNGTGPYPAESPVSVADLQLMYPIASQRAKDDASFAEAARQATLELQDGRPGYRALWQHFRTVSIDAMREVYEDLGVHFDLWNGESTVHDRIQPMIERLIGAGLTRLSDGAIVVDVADEADTKEIPPLLLAKTDGAYLYGTSDLATIEERIEDLGARIMVYVVDVRQSLHFEQVFRAARLTGIAAPDVVLEHAGNGTVNGPDGKPFKTRDGDLLRLADLVAMVVERATQRLDENELATGYPREERHRIAHLVGMAALKFGDLHNHRASNYIFDVERFTSFEGKTGPYLLYGAVRAKSILRKAAEGALDGGPIIPASRDTERNLMLQLTRLPEVFARAVEHRAPNQLAEYAFEFAADFNRFLADCHILSEPDAARQGSWLALVGTTLRQLELVLDLLGIDIPERM
ncbi:MAG: arginine--tRNA ligase [Acidimicrobiia bacterium]|nr:arginine--tRNA ligase [Acidimicrobiia bacterium]